MRLGEEVPDFYRTRFQIEFGYRDTKNCTIPMYCQAKDAWKLDLAFDASFASLSVVKMMHVKCACKKCPHYLRKRW